MLFPQKIWMLNLKLQPCEATETILLKNILYGDVKPPSKKLSCSLSFSMVAQFLWKTYRPPLKEHCWHLFGKERYLFGGKVSFTKNKVHQPHFLWKSKKCIENMKRSFQSHYLFQHMQRSLRRNPAGFYLDRNAIYLKKIYSPQREMYIPKGLTLQRKIALKAYLRMFSIQLLFVRGAFDTNMLL